MKVKEQLAIYNQALEAEERFRVEVNAKIDARIATIHDLIEGTKKLIALGDGSESEVPIDDEDSGSEQNHHSEASGSHRSKKKSSAASKKTSSKKTSSKKTVKVFTKATGSAPKSKKGADIPRPRLEDSIQIVMGSKELSAPEIRDELRSRHWIPDSKDPLGYIRYALSANPAIFLRRQGVRGKYHLDPSNPYATGKHKGPIEGHVNPKSKKKGKLDATTVASVEVAVTTQPPESVPTSVVVQSGQREDPASVVTDLLKDGGLKSFGRQAPPLETSTE